MAGIQLKFSFERVSNELRIKFNGDRPDLSRDEYVQQILGRSSKPKYRLEAEEDECELVVEKCDIINSIQQHNNEDKTALVEVKWEHVENMEKYFPAPGKRVVVPTEDGSGDYFLLMIPCSFTPDEYREALGCWRVVYSSAKRRGEERRHRSKERPRPSSRRRITRAGFS